MNDKYSALKKEYEETIHELAQAAGWPEEQAGRVLAVLLNVSEKNACAVTEQHKKAERTAKLEDTKNLLKNYRKLKWSIECGTEHTLKLLADNEYQRLMEMEESVQNQRLRSTVLLTAGNQVLWARLNTALDCFKELCANDPRPRVQRQYQLIYKHYMSSTVMSVDDILELTNMDRSLFYKDIREATRTICVILFGAESAADIS